ncbi:MAG: chemotaxis protein CheD [Rhodobacteraceae bacterium]|nr:chemotaxis protein CheD [Paracoccaceae bacterium]NNK65221.1 chemotaxis protein CheD [Paracoccaceae bacterium]
MSGQKTYITQGEQAIGDQPGHMIVTILGSCVAVCLWDPAARTGGMNHILLPETPASSIGFKSAGACAMEMLINGLLKSGAEKERLRAKVFGGAAIISGLSDIGLRNCAFARDFLLTEGIPTDAESLGGSQARQIRFWPYTGKVRQRFVPAVEAPPTVVPPAPAGNDMELF